MGETNFDKKQKSTVWAVPGFLGLATDWNFLNWDNLKRIELNRFDLSSLTAWAEQFNNAVCHFSKIKSHILMGYSLGGRLALHALVERPELWKGAIIISTHPGLTKREEQKKRVEKDQQWAERFRKEEWNSLMQDWNSQDSFAEELFHPQRHEHHYHRMELAHILIHLSLGHQKDLRHQIEELPMPLLWLTGSNDRRYNQIAESVRFAHALSRWEKIAGAGHRVPWTHPSIFSHRVACFLKEINLF